jgi:8-oxo-dGTP pyrophosphatase MutT (NUDIX family)
MTPWKKLSSSYLLQRWWMNLRVDRVLLPNGVELPEYHVVEHPNWVAVVCLTEEGKVLMVEQYRYAVNQASLELPAGAIEDGEDPLAAAKRELLEETGHEADDWTFLGRCAQDPSRQTNFAYFYVARNARKVAEQELDESELLTIHPYVPAEVLEMVDREEIVHGLHVAALLWAWRQGIFESVNHSRARRAAKKAL